MFNNDQDILEWLADKGEMGKRAIFRLKTLRESLKYLADVVGAAMGLRHVDFAAGEELATPCEFSDHALFIAMLKTIQERDAALAELDRLRKVLSNACAEAKR